MSDNTSHIVDTLVRLNSDHHRRMAEAAHDGDAALADRGSRKEIVDAMLGCRARFGLGDAAGGVILEIGAGYAGDREYLMTNLRADYVGIEVVPHVAVASLGRGVQNLAIEQAPLAWNGRYKWIYSRHVMEHVPDVDLALATIARVLASDGVVGAVTPHYFPDPEPAHISQLRIETWMAAYRKHGLTPVCATTPRYACMEAHLVAVHTNTLRRVVDQWPRDAADREAIRRLLDG